MPTTRPRHTITETEEVAQWLDDAARRWPEDKAVRGRLLLRLLQEGHRVLHDEQTERRAKKQEAIRRWSGAFSDVYPDGYLEELRSEWPD